MLILDSYWIVVLMLNFPRQVLLSLRTSDKPPVLEVGPKTTEINSVDSFQARQRYTIIITLCKLITEDP